MISIAATVTAAAVANLVRGNALRYRRRRMKQGPFCARAGWSPRFCRLFYLGDVHLLVDGIQNPIYSATFGFMQT